MPLSRQEINTIRKKEYEPFRKQLDIVENIIDGNHEAWWFRTMLFLRRLQRSLKKNPEQYSDQTQVFVSTLIAQIISELALQVKSDETHSKNGHEVILALSEEIPKGLQLETNAVHVTARPLEELVQQYERISFIQLEGQDEYRRGIRILDSQNNPHDFPLPKVEGILHKGGFARVLIKIMASADESLIDAELPPNDFDIIADSTLDAATVEKEAHVLNVDADGIEYISSPNFERLFLERDLDLNMVFVGADTIYFAQEAIEAAQSGKIEVMSAHRGIYGTEFFVYDGQRLLKNRGLMRLFKTVVEGKATHFDFTPLNENISFGIYWLVLFRKFVSKDTAGVHLDRLFEIAKKTNQTPKDTENIIEVLDTIHAKYPFFDFDALPLDEVGVTRWLGKKLLRQIDASYRHTHSIPNELIIERTPNDTVPYRVDLNDYVPHPEKIAWITSEIPNFLDRCRERTRAFKAITDSTSPYDID